MWTDQEIEEILADEDFDITAVYDLGKGGLGDNFAFERGMREARRKHKEAGVPMVISRDGKIVHIQPEDIEID